MAFFKVLLAVQFAFVLLSVSVDSASILPPKPSPISLPPKPSPTLLPPKPSPILPPKSSPPVLPPKGSPFYKRKLVAVQGVVYCRTCKYLLFPTLLDAKALPGAVVKLQCNNTKKPITVTATTDKKGYFYIQAPKKVTTHGTHKCRVFLVSSPSSKCKVATNFNGGVKGAYLRYEPKQPAKPSGYTLYTVGPLAFSPNPKTCKHW